MNYYGLLDERLQESVWETRIPLKIKMKILKYNLIFKYILFNLK